MRKHVLCLLFAVVAFSHTRALRAAETPSSNLQASNLLNPNISAIGWFQAEAGHRVDAGDHPAFDLKEAEIAFQSVVDSYAKADFFISVHENEIDLEEGYINWFALPGGLSLKAGKFRANFGKFNRTHTPETAFADRPLAADRYFGEEGLSGTGASVSWQVPVPFILNVDAEAMTAPDEGESPTFTKAEKNDLLYVGRLSTYFDVSESANFTIGTSYAHGPAGQEFDAVENSSTTLLNQTAGADVTFRWRNPIRAIYRSLMWQTEIYRNRRELDRFTHENSFGAFSHLDVQVARRWHVGGRFDYSQSPVDHHALERGGLTYATFTPTEFSSISLQGRRVTWESGERENLAFLKTTFNIGPHGAHPF